MERGANGRRQDNLFCKVGKGSENKEKTRISIELGKD